MEAEAANNRQWVEPDSEKPSSSPDLINGLPDKMLHIIISFLPIKSSFRASVLSKRWIHLRCSVPLDFIVDDDLSDQVSNQLAVFSSIYKTYPSPAKRLSIPPFNSDLNGSNPAP
ncbi:hypothetical protein QYE76_063313 [Lolium multiflorum]|uniref:F-box domain-containing protein n=1 Tax=Lolium multiflorum TaxID=4521 RepID=A0AAD8S680_LOLMU|nr:hypothetical protein QYE76_063313 [Lolium multiflorum]